MVQSDHSHSTVRRASATSASASATTSGASSWQSHIQAPHRAGGSHQRQLHTEDSLKSAIHPSAFDPMVQRIQEETQSPQPIKSASKPEKLHSPPDRHSVEKAKLMQTVRISFGRLPASCIQFFRDNRSNDIIPSFGIAFLPYWFCSRFPSTEFGLGFGFNQSSALKVSLKKSKILAVKRIGMSSSSKRSANAFKFPSFARRRTKWAIFQILLLTLQTQNFPCHDLSKTLLQKHVDRVGLPYNHSCLFESQLLYLLIVSV